MTQQRNRQTFGRPQQLAYLPSQCVTPRQWLSRRSQRLCGYVQCVIGYHEMFVRAGVAEGEQLPSNVRMFVRIAPIDLPSAAVAFAGNDGNGDITLNLQAVTEVKAVSDSWGFIGFGAAGMVGAGIAAELDRLMAPWELHISGPRTQIVLYAHHGPPPSADDWARLEVRLRVPQQHAWSPPSYDEEEDEDEHYLDPFGYLVILHGLHRQELCGETLGRGVTKSLRKVLKVLDEWPDKWADPDEDMMIFPIAEIYVSRPDRLERTQLKVARAITFGSDVPEAVSKILYRLSEALDRTAELLEQTRLQAEAEDLS